MDLIDKRYPSIVEILDKLGEKIIELQISFDKSASNKNYINLKSAYFLLSKHFNFNIDINLLPAKEKYTFNDFLRLFIYFSENQELKKTPEIEQIIESNDMVSNVYHTTLNDSIKREIRRQRIKMFEENRIFSHGLDLSFTIKRNHEVQKKNVNRGIDLSNKFNQIPSSKFVPINNFESNKLVLNKLYTSIEFWEKIINIQDTNLGKTNIKSQFYKLSVNRYSIKLNILSILLN